ncbi:MAG: hypothetical protein V7K15_17680 [Nostoc sp.]
MLLVEFNICFFDTDQEYQEFLGQCRDLHSELSEERKIGKDGKAFHSFLIYQTKQHRWL